MTQLAILGGPPILPPRPTAHTSRAERDAAALQRALARATHEPAYIYSFRSGAVAEIERTLGSAIGIPHVLGLASGTAAVHLALAVCGVGPGDEVITSPYTWPQVVSPILERLAIPVFADIDPTTYTLAPDSVAGQISERTRAILVVHQFGHPADMTALGALARRHGLRIVEDCAQALGALWCDEAVGTFGDVGCFSFGLAKMVSGLEGGALVTRNADLYARALAWSQHPARQAYELGLEAYGDGIAPGSRLHPLAAVLAIADLHRLNDRFRRRDTVAARLCERLRLPGICPPRAHATALHAFHRFSPTFVAEETPGVDRDLLIGALVAEGVPICRGYVGAPIHLLPALRARRFAHAPLDVWEAVGSDRTYGPGDCPLAERRCADEELGIDLPDDADEQWADAVILACEKVIGQLGTLQALQRAPGNGAVSDCTGRGV